MKQNMNRLLIAGPLVWLAAAVKHRNAIPYKLTAFLLVSSLAGLAGNAASGFAGTWEGKVNELPAVELTLTYGGGNVSGTIAFYLQMRGKDGKWHVVGDKDKAAQPLLSPRIEGNILTFEVTHHKKHDSPELGPNKTFRVELTGTNEARLREAGGSSDVPGHGLQLRRTR